MIKDILEQLAPLDAQIAALKGSGSDMEAITAHASELAELAVEEDEILRSCGPLTAEDRVFLARHPERPHIDETISALFTDFFEQRGDRQCKEDAAILGGVARFHGMPVTSSATARAPRWRKIWPATLECRGRRVTARLCA